VSSFSTIRRFFTFATGLWPCYRCINAIGQIRHRICIYNRCKSLRRKHLRGLGVKKMKVNKIKLVVMIAGLMLAGVLLASAARATSLSVQDSNTGVSGQTQKNTASSESSYEQFGVSGGREFFYKMLVSILVVAVLGAGVVYVSRKLLPKISNLPGKQIRIIETHHLGPRKSIHLISVGSRRLLIGNTSERITMLSDVTDSDSSFAAELEKRS
jgi:flagellar biogenesis protein FliO